MADKRTLTRPQAERLRQDKLFKERLLERKLHQGYENVPLLIRQGDKTYVVGPKGERELGK